MIENPTIDAKDRRLPARWAALMFPLILSICMTFVVSGIATFRAVGAADHFIGLWMGSWAVSWAIGFPVLLLVLPAVRKIVGLIVRPA